MTKSDDKSISRRLAELKKELRIRSNRAFALSLDVDPSLFSKILKSERSINDTIVDNLKNKYGVNKDWILYGRGEKFGQIPNTNGILDPVGVKMADEQYIKDLLQTKSMVKTLIHVVAEMKAKAEGRTVSDVLSEIHEKNTNDLIDLAKQYTQSH